MNETHATAIDPRKAFDDEVEKIRALPQSERWRAIKNLLYRVRPDFVEIDKAFMRDVKERRDFEMLKDTGASKSGSTRALYTMPELLYAVLHLLDPEFTRLQEDPESSKAINLKIARTFPEYCLARKV